MTSATLFRVLLNFLWEQTGVNLCQLASHRGILSQSDESIGAVIEKCLHRVSASSVNEISV